MLETPIWVGRRDLRGGNGRGSFDLRQAAVTINSIGTAVDTTGDLTSSLGSSGTVTATLAVGWRRHAARVRRSRRRL